MASLDSLAVSMKELEKLVTSSLKELRKIRQRLDDPTGEKAKARSENNSFKKPLQVSDKLRKFLGLADGELISRSDVTKRLSAYAKEKGLNNGKEINMDEALKDLLNPPEGVKISIMNIQRYINHHYVGRPDSSSTTPPPVVATGGATPAAPKKGKPKVNV